MLSRYAQWLHTGWPAGQIEKRPEVDEEGRTNVPGLFVVGDLTGVPLLKFAADSGVAVVERIHRELSAEGPTSSGGLDLVIIGAGVSGCAAAIEARRRGLNFEIFEASQTFSTLKNFPRQKPIFTYPTDMKQRGDLEFRHDVKEPLVDDLDAQLAALGIVPTIARVERVRRTQGEFDVVLDPTPQGEARRVAARRVIIAIGRSGEFRTLGVPGEDLGKVSNRLHDPQEFADQEVVVVGGGDSALETAVALTVAGARVRLSYRGEKFTRVKPENLARMNALVADPAADVGIDRPGSSRVTAALTRAMLPKPRVIGQLDVALNTTITRIDEEQLELTHRDGRIESIDNQAVFIMIGREAPLEFFRKSGVRIHGEWSTRSWIGLIAFFCFCVWVYHWKSYGWFPIDAMNPAEWIGSSLASLEPSTFLYTLLKSASGPSFYYTLLYSCTIGYFGFRRIKRRNTPYVTRQTYALLFFQWLPLFILPEIILPMMGRNGWFLEGATLAPLADLFFEPTDQIGVERAYWRAYGFILAWPLMVYNWFTDQPMVGWLVLGFIQTFVLIPLLVWRWGKGAFCGWMCSCGALAETLGDRHRHKMPHGPFWNRLNMVGQVVLIAAFIMLAIRIYGWMVPHSWAAQHFNGLLSGQAGMAGALSYKWIVDIALAGFLGVGFYFHYSGRVWCRFACPLAALMHIYARFSRFRIFPEKKKCISCNVCTSVCHQGIDIMSFANQGLPMADPQCVRCSACIQSCPTGVLRFGRYGRDGQRIYDGLPASLVQMTEALNHR
ncbi:MAG: NAD(P)-binding domain-containing protein [Myxococcota bacterium]|nr:NAD(P)-binding domain-containing protein [Myxococcota bacterium]